jgi:poly(beta-D-mannuronate) lyase
MRTQSISHRLSKPMLGYCLTIGLATCLTSSPATAASWLVHDSSEFATAAAALQPGDEIVLADGTWTDARLLLKGQGTAAAPIVLRAQTPGKVILSGASDLRLAGSYLQVSNLVFRNGYTPGDAVVAFRESSKAVASHSRVTGLVIDDYSNPDGSDQDYWVSLYGSNNRLDHS